MRAARTAGYRPATAPMRIVTPRPAAMTSGGRAKGQSLIAAAINDWPFALPPLVIAAGLGVTILIGAVAGLYPAVRAARTPPTAALNAQ